MPRIIRTASALQDVEGIWDYIAVKNHSPHAADHIIDEIDAALRLPRSRPRLGEAVEHLRPHTRRYVVQRHYLIFYDTPGDDIRLFRVLHAARLIRREDLQVDLSQAA